MSGNEKKPTTRNEFEEQIIKRAQSDKDFKEALIENPKGALGRLGVQLSEDVEVKVVEESAKVVYLVLPVNPDELTDKQLDNVTGGNGYSYETYPNYLPEQG
ncbi:MAG: NHLP leader peptide family natural product precursor [Peptococcaceae bacterium]|nr:NHLP leader peptide family natural product precursor [Peptococcaceae bacterium]